LLLLERTDGAHPMGPMLEMVNFLMPKLYAVCRPKTTKTNK
jgi:hypothetical protein